MGVNKGIFEDAPVHWREFDHAVDAIGLKVFTEEGLERFDKAISGLIQKGQASSLSAAEEIVLEKAVRDRSKLVKKVVTDKTGKKTTRWVKPAEAGGSSAQKTSTGGGSPQSGGSAKSPQDHAKDTSDDKLQNYIKTGTDEGLVKIAKEELKRRNGSSEPTKTEKVNNPEGVKNQADAKAEAVSEEQGFTIPKAVKDKFNSIKHKMESFYNEDPKAAKGHLDTLDWDKKVPHLIRQKAKGIVKGLKHEVHEWKVAAQGVAALAKGEPLTDNHKKALREVAIHTALVVGSTVATGGMAGGLVKIASGLGIHFLEHSLAVNGLKALAFAKAAEGKPLNLPLTDSEAEDLLEKLVLMFADYIEDNQEGEADDTDNEEPEEKEDDKPEITKAINDLGLLEKGGKPAKLGEVRRFGDGRNYIKTADGWKYHASGKRGDGDKVDAHDIVSTKKTRSGRRISDNYLPSATMYGKFTDEDHKDAAAYHRAKSNELAASAKNKTGKDSDKDLVSAVEHYHMAELHRDWVSHRSANKMHELISKQYRNYGETKKKLSGSNEVKKVDKGSNGFKWNKETAPSMSKKISDEIGAMFSDMKLVANDHGINISGNIDRSGSYNSHTIQPLGDGTVYANMYTEVVTLGESLADPRLAYQNTSARRYRTKKIRTQADAESMDDLKKIVQRHKDKVDRALNKSHTPDLEKAFESLGVSKAMSAGYGGNPLVVESLQANLIDTEDDVSKGGKNKTEFSQSERDALAKKGHALPDGSFPIRNGQDLKDAIKSVGLAKDQAKAKAHIKKRAKALKLEKLIPNTWT